MLEPNVKKILSQLKPGDKVLDVGGWAQPFNRADYVLDMFPYESRGFYKQIGMAPFAGPGKENFSRATWIVRDVCDRTPWPFKAKQFDYAVCSHLLEDIRDPVWVCSELVRVAKRGYLEFPSRLQESIRDARSNAVGAAHHRWLITAENGKLVFRMKPHLMHHADKHFPAYMRDLFPPEKLITSLFWEHEFKFEETKPMLSDEEIGAELGAFIRAYKPRVPFGFPVVWQLKDTANHLRRILPPFLMRPLRRVWGRYKERQRVS